MKTWFDYDPHNHISICTIQKNGDSFIGVTRVYPEDMDVASVYIGCQFAEIKAAIQLHKHNYKEYKKELKVLTDLYNKITQLKEYPENEHQRVCQFIRKQIRMKEAQVAAEKEIVDTYQENYPKVVENRIAKSRNLPEKLAARARNREAIKKAGELCNG